MILPGRQRQLQTELWPIEVDTGLNLFGTRDSLKSAISPGTVEDQCFRLGRDQRGRNWFKVFGIGDP